MNLFKKPKPAPKAKAGKPTKIYIKDYRPGQKMIKFATPGLKEPDVMEWFDVIPIPHMSPAAMAKEPGVIKTPTGQTARLTPKLFSVVFIDGCAEVSQALATFMIGEEQCYAKPQKSCNWHDPRIYAPTEAEA